MRSVWVHVIIELEGQSPVNAIVWGEVEGTATQIELAREDMGPFDTLWDVARWWHRVVTSWRPSRIV
jgi:hypothetical protein